MVYSEGIYDGLFKEYRWSNLHLRWNERYLIVYFETLMTQLQS